MISLSLAASACGLWRRESSGSAEGTNRRGSDREERSTVQTTTADSIPPLAAGRRVDPGAGSPRRVASQRLVEEAKGYLIAGRAGDAWLRLKEAIRLDGSNGIAWFHLAGIAADRREWSEAEGYHARAAALLGGRAEYREPLDELATRIAQHR